MDDQRGDDGLPRALSPTPTLTTWLADEATVVTDEEEDLSLKCFLEDTTLVPPSQTKQVKQVVVPSTWIDYRMFRWNREN